MNVKALLLVNAIVALICYHAFLLVEVIDTTEKGWPQQGTMILVNVGLGRIVYANTNPGGRRIECWPSLSPIWTVVRLD
jgi:hypothetical protein